jgi:hypothetical protein
VHGVHDLTIALILQFIGYFTDHNWHEIEPVGFGASVRFELL